MTELKSCQIGDVAEIIGGGTPSTKNEKNFGGDIAWITPKDLSNHDAMYISKGERSITGIGLENSSAKLLPANSILFTSRAPIGYVALAKNEIATNQGFKSLVLKDDNDPKFFYYLLKNITPQIKSYASGSTFQEISGKVLSTITIKIPNANIQKRIGEFLEKFDKKIELNKKNNETIEEISKALFKSWFIDFDPVIAKAEGRSTGLPDEISDLFPNSFEDSEIGQIPNSWDIKKISAWGETVCGKTPSTKNESYYGNDYMFVTIPDLHKGLHITSSSKGLSKSGAELQSKKLLSKGSILVSCIATPGLIGVIQESCFTNQQINSITPNNKNCTWFIAFYLLMNKDLLLSFGGGGSVFFNLNKSKFDSIEILSPPEKIIDKFNQFVFPLMNKCFAHKREISFLSNIRDTLLPKLISGELRISDAEKIIEEAGI